MQQRADELVEEHHAAKALEDEITAREEHAKVLAEFSLKQRETILRWSQAKREWDRWLVHEGIDPERAAKIRRPRLGSGLSSVAGDVPFVCAPAVSPG